MLIDLEHQKLLQEKIYERKIKNIEQKVQEELQAKKEMKTKHEVKLDQAKHKNEQIQKDLEEQQRKMQLRAEKDMEAKASKHEKLEKQKMDQLKKREEDFEKKRQRIEQLKREQEAEEQRIAQLNLQKLDMKLKESSDKHAHELNRVISEARIRNTMQSEKVIKWKDWREKMEVEDMKRMWESEQQYSKKMQRIAKSTQDLHQSIKEKKLMKLEKQNHNKQLHEDETDKKLENIMKKFKQAEQNVEHLKVRLDYEQHSVWYSKKETMTCS